MITDHFHRSERLVYREIDEDTDLDMFHRLRTDPVVNQWMWAFVCSPWSKKRAAKSLIFDKAIIQVTINIPKDLEEPNGEVISIGIMRLMHPGFGMEHHRRADFMMMLDPAYHRKGFGEEALRWLLRTGFRHANLHKIEGSYNHDNLPAAKLYQKVGFTIEGVQRQHTWVDGEWKDEVAIGILRSEWEETQIEGQNEQRAKTA